MRPVCRSRTKDARNERVTRTGRRRHASGTPTGRAAMYIYITYGPPHPDHAHRPPACVPAGRGRADRPSDGRARAARSRLDVQAFLASARRRFRTQPRALAYARRRDRRAARPGQRPIAYPCIPRGFAAAFSSPSSRPAALTRPSDQSSVTSTSWPRSRSSAMTAGSNRPSIESERGRI